jgi:hypothetical protein
MLSSQIVWIDCGNGVIVYYSGGMSANIFDKDTIFTRDGVVCGAGEPMPGDGLTVTELGGDTNGYATQIDVTSGGS